MLAGIIPLNKKKFVLNRSNKCENISIKSKRKQQEIKKSILLHNIQIVYPGQRIEHGSLLLEDDIIKCINPVKASLSPDMERIDGKNCLLTPGLIDLHTHGIHTYLYDFSAEHCLAGSRILPEYGTTSFCPTLIPHVTPELLDKLETYASILTRAEGALIPGLHLEGPFVALPGAGCETAKADIGLLDEIISACKHQLRIMSISPDSPGILPVIERLCEYGVIPFMTHTRATVEQTQAALDAGARHATHFYDVFPMPEETDAGVRPAGAVETILSDPRASVDFIADGVHVHPVAIKVALAAKSYERVLLITDSNIGTGLPPGTYETPWGYPVKAAPGKGARIADPDHPSFGGLAGSTLTMNQGIANLLQWLNIPSEQVWAFGTLNPARLLKLTEQGIIKEGAQANLVLWNNKLEPLMTCVKGSWVYRRKEK